MSAANHAVGAAIRLRAVLVILLACFGSLFYASAQAHEMRPAIVTASFDRSGDVEIRIALNLEAQIAGIGPEHSSTAQSGNAPLYDRLRAMSAAALEKAFAPVAGDLVDALHISFDGARTKLRLEKVEIPSSGDTALARSSVLILRGTAPPGAKTMTWMADPRFGENVFRVARNDAAKPFYSVFLSAGETSRAIPLNGAIEQKPWSGFVKYVTIGFEHIVPKGFDHILFVIGLFLLSPNLRPLLWQVTAFTLAHSVTLALGIYGLVSVSSAIVEPLIAASIAFVAIENLFTDRLQRWRPAVVFAFGLLHGLGFAGVLSEIGIPRDQFVTALIGFNIGVEFGQLAVIAACFLGVGLWFRRRHWYRRAITMPASVMIALVATYWFAERIA